MSAHRSSLAWTLEEFLDWERGQELRHEFDGVQPVAMTGGTWRLVMSSPFARPMTAVPTCPVMATIGTESSLASARQVTKLVAPGPEVAMQTPTLPVARA